MRACATACSMNLILKSVADWADGRRQHGKQCLVAACRVGESAQGGRCEDQRVGRERSGGVLRRAVNPGRLSEHYGWSTFDLSVPVPYEEIRLQEARRDRRKRRVT